MIIKKERFPLSLPYLVMRKKTSCITICHSDDRKEEDEFLRTPSEKSRKHKMNTYENFRFALDDRSF